MSWSRQRSVCIRVMADGPCAGRWKVSEGGLAGYCPWPSAWARRLPRGLHSRDERERPKRRIGSTAFPIFPFFGSTAITWFGRVRAGVNRATHGLDAFN